jgi:magnesium transporter
MSGAISELAATFVARHPLEAAVVLEPLDAQDVRRVLSQIEGAKTFEVLSHMSPDCAARALQDMDEQHARAAFATADFVRLALILAQLEGADRERLFALLTPDQRRNVDAALEYPLGSAGRLMDPKVTTFREEQRAGDVLVRLREAPFGGSPDVLVVNADGLLKSTVSLRDLVTAGSERVLGSLARQQPFFVNAMATRDEVVELLQRHHLSTLPVVDLDGRVLGVLRHDALIEAAQHAATDDLQQMVGASKDERALSSPLFTVRSRLPWLVINLATGFVAASVVGLFDATIAKLTALAVLMPVVAGQAGNTGAQSLAVVSRGLALREIRLGHAARVLRKEALAAAINGCTVASLTAIGTLVWSRNPVLALVIGASMVGSMVIAALAGATVPMVLTALKRDPATASSIVLTTVTDVTGFSSFLGLATLLSELIARG